LYENDGGPPWSAPTRLWETKQRGSISGDSGPRHQTRELLDRSKAVNAEALAAALGGKKVGGGWIARCPSHDDREPSLSIRDADDGKVLVRCHAGCDQEQVIAALRSRRLWTENGRRRLTLNPVRILPKAPPNRDDNERREAALAIWRSTVPASGTLVECYLNSRRLYVSPPPTLRFHAGLNHPRGGIWPAMVALVTRGSDDKPIAIHRTYLARDGNGKAPVNPQKMMLGPCLGGAVRLSGPGDILMVGEGIETCLAALRATGHPTWAALSTSGLRSLDLPEHVRNVMVLADGDEPGELAARNSAWRWKHEGRRVWIARPPYGKDFNDLLMGRVACVEEGAR